MNASPTSTREPLPRTTTAALVAMALAIFIIANDLTALGVAIPKMQASLDANITTAQWFINGYALTFGVLIVTGGRLADMLGRRLLFFIGLGLFAVTSLLGGLAVDSGELITCRVLMGVGAALMWPAVLGITYSLIPAARAGLAGGLILGVAGIGNSIGPLLGGFVADVLSWRWIFFINVPIALVLAVIAARTVPESRGDTANRKIDFFGVGMLMASITMLLVGLDDLATDESFNPVTIALLVAGVVFLVIFLVTEMQQGDRAIIPRDVSRNRKFTVAWSARLLLSAIFFSVLVYVPMYLVKELGFSTLEAGIGLLPMMTSLAVASFVAGPLYGRVGAKLITTLGAGLMAAGIFELSLLGARSHYWELAPGLLLLGIGAGLFYSAITTFGVTAVDPSQASLAGGIIYMVQIVGGAIGLAVNTLIIEAFASLADGIQWAYRADAVLAVLGTLVCLFFVGGQLEARHRAVTRHTHRVHA